MKDFKLNKIVIYNFACYLGRNELNFTCKNGKRHVYLFNVLNGHGKTSLFHAIKWGFYGEKVQYYKDSNKVSNKDFMNDRLDKKKDSCHVEIFFDFGKDSYVLKRKYQPSLKDKSELSLSKNGRLINEETAEEEINVILPPKYADFFMFDGERLRDLITSQSEVHIRDNIHQILGLRQLRILRDDLKQLTTDYQERLTQTKSANNDVEQKKTIIKALQKDKANHELRIAKEKDLIAANIELINALHEKLEKFKNRDEVVAQFTEVKTRRDRTSDAIDGLKSEIIENGGKIYLQFLREDLLMIRAKNSTRITELQDISGITDDEATFQKVVDKILSKSIPVCEICHHKISDAEKTALQERKNKIKSNLRIYDANKGEVMQLEKEIHSINEALRDAESYDFQKSLDELEQKRVALKDLEIDYKRLEAEFQTGKYGEASQISSSIGGLQSENGGKKTQIDLWSKQIHAIDEKIGALTKEIAKLGYDDKLAYDLSQKATKCQKLVEQLNQALDLGVELKRRSILEQANKIFLEITNKPEEYDSLEFESPESFSFVIRYKTGSRVSMNTISKGEKMVLAISFLVGLNQFTGRNNVILMDTPVASLDDVHSAGLGKLIADIDNQVIFLAQPQELKGKIYDNLKGAIAREFTVKREDYKSEFKEISHG